MATYPSRVRPSVSLQPLPAEERDDMLALFAAVRRFDNEWRGKRALDAAAALVAKMRYGMGPRDALACLDELEAALRDLR